MAILDRVEGMDGAFQRDPSLVKHLLAGRMDLRERGLLVAAALLIASALLLPIWRVYLWAPQYPEGLRVYIHARDLTGNVQGINILNHYIGMKPLSVEMFSEFIWMTPVLAALAALMLLIALVGRRELALPGWLVLVGFDFFMLWDLHRWMYDWGHNLDPMAAMTIDPFTPPVLGFKQIANFVVWSLPTWGGVTIMCASLVGPLWVWFSLKRSPSR